jgi:hypothetical protein
MAGIVSEAGNVMPNRVIQAAQSIKTAGTSTGISQDNIIFGMVLLAFVIFITLKGELRTYMGFFTPSGSLGPAAVPVSTAAQTSTPVATAQTGAINGLINSTGLGGLITSLTGVNPLSVSVTPNSIASGIGSIFSGIGNLFGGQGITGGAAPVTTPQPGSNPTGGIGSA